MVESQADALEAEAHEESVQIALADQKLTVPPMNQWRSSALSAMINGDFETWAAKTLSEEDYETYADIDPTIDELEAFFDRVTEAQGTSRGKSRPRSGSSKNKPRR